MSRKKKGWSFDCGATHNIWGQKLDKRPLNIYGRPVGGDKKPPKKEKSWW